MTDETYDGWTNYESWLVALWLDNEQGSQEQAREIATQAASDLAAGEAIKSLIEDDVEAVSGWGSAVPQNGMIVDLINAALSRVDWREVGAHFREP